MDQDQEPGMPEEQLRLRWDCPCVRNGNETTYSPYLIGISYGLFLLSKVFFTLEVFYRLKQH